MVFLCAVLFSILWRKQCYWFFVRNYATDVIYELQQWYIYIFNNVQFLYVVIYLFILNYIIMKTDQIISKLVQPNNSCLTTLSFSMFVLNHSKYSIQFHIKILKSYISSSYSYLFYAYIYIYIYIYIFIT